MGRVLRSIPFFVDTIALAVHTASPSKRSTIGCRTTIREFSKGAPCRLLENVETGEYTCQLLNGDFMEGPEVTN